MTPLSHVFFDGRIVAGLDQSESQSQMFFRLWCAAMQRWSSKKRTLHPIRYAICWLEVVAKVAQKYAQPDW